MREGIFADLLGAPMTVEEENHYQMLTATLQKALTDFDYEILALHKRVMDRKAAEHKPAKVLTMKQKGQ